MLILMGSSGAAQDDISLQELQAIESLISGKDWRALYTYVVANPKFTSGNDPLAVELRSFVDDTKRGFLNTFDADPDRTTGGETRTSVSIY